MTTIRAKDIDTNKITFSEVKKLDSGAKVSYINYNNDKLTIQTPVMSLPYGLSSFTNEDTKDTKYDLTVSFGNMNENEKIKQFHDKMIELQKCVIEKAIQKENEWFTLKSAKKDQIPALVENMFCEFVKSYYDKEKKEFTDKYPPTMKVKLPYNKKDNTYGIVCHNMDTNEEMVFNDIKNNLKGARAQLIIQLTGIWISAGKFGCSWKVIMGKFRLSQMKKAVYLSDSDVEEEEKEEEDDKDLTLEEEAMTKSKEGKKAEEEVIDSEEEDNVVSVEESDEDDMPPPPAKGKKGTRTKK